MKREDEGFTLVELLVALALAGLIVTSAHAALGVLHDASRRSRTAREPVLSSVASRAMLSGWLRAATLADGAGPFVGSDRGHGTLARDELAFDIVDGGELRAGAHRVHLWVDNDPLTAAQGLMVELTPRWGYPATSPETLSIVPWVTGLDIRYLVEVDGRARWIEEWQSQTKLPIAVEIRLSRLSRVRLGAPQETGLEPLLELPLLVPVGPGGF